MADDGEHGKEEGMARAIRGANPEWAAEMDRFARTIAKRQAELTTEDVWLMHHKFGKYATPEPRALGPIMRELARDGIIRLTNKTIRSTLASQHRRPLQVWKSLIA